MVYGKLFTLVHSEGKHNLTRQNRSKDIYADHYPCTELLNAISYGLRAHLSLRSEGNMK